VIFIEKNNTDPYFNIAAEEYVLKHSDGDVLMIWQNKSSVIIGKHQNIFKEVNLPYTLHNNIPVIRRISGGGTVFHDLGNINYTLISLSKDNSTLVDFVKFTQPVIEFFKTFGIKAEFEGKNNLAVRKLKISGNSAHVFKNKTLYHGTLLFNTNLDSLEKSITPSTPDIEDKAINSVRKEVVNISKYLPDTNTSEFLQKFKDFMINFFNIKETLSLSEDSKNEILKFINNKYKTDDWTFGYSPSYVFKNRTEDLQITITVEKGKIKILETDKKLKGLENLLINKLHSPSTIEKAAENFNPELKPELLKLFGFL